MTRTPTATYFDSTGKEKKRIPIENKMWTKVKQRLVKLVSGRPVHTAKWSSTECEHVRTVRLSGDGLQAMCIHTDWIL